MKMPEKFTKIKRLVVSFLEAFLIIVRGMYSLAIEIIFHVVPTRTSLRERISTSPRAYYIGR